MMKLIPERMQGLAQADQVRRMVVLLRVVIVLLGLNFVMGLWGAWDASVRIHPEQDRSKRERKANTDAIAQDKKRLEIIEPQIQRLLNRGERIEKRVFDVEQQVHTHAK